MADLDKYRTKAEKMATRAGKKKGTPEWESTVKKFMKSMGPREAADLIQQVADGVPPESLIEQGWDEPGPDGQQPGGWETYYAGLFDTVARLKTVLPRAIANDDTGPIARQASAILDGVEALIVDVAMIDDPDVNRSFDMIRKVLHQNF